MSFERDPERDQSLPKRTDEVFTHDLVIEDIRGRLEFGIRKYGNGLQPNNGRNSMQDAYEEALDLAVYLKNQLRFARSEQARALREAALIWYTDEGPWQNPLNSATWLRKRADEIENDS